MSPEWLNSFVIVKKPNGSLRICLDPTGLNKEIVRPVCNSQTMDDVIEKLKGAKYFAVFDTSKGLELPCSSGPGVQIINGHTKTLWDICL